jgi:hypothetical protein
VFVREPNLLSHQSVAQPLTPTLARNRFSIDAEVIGNLLLGVQLRERDGVHFDVRG